MYIPIISKLKLYCVRFKILIHILVYNRRRTIEYFMRIFNNL